MIQYYLPLLYTFKTRCNNNIFAILSFMFVNFFLSFMIIIFENNISLFILVNYIIVFITMYSAYECGYLFNDILTVKFEKNPTLRIEKQYLPTIMKHLENMITIRVAIIVTGSFFVYSFDKNIRVFIIALLLLFIVYSLHNYFRNKINIITMFLLLILKNFILTIPFLNKCTFTETIFLVIIAIAAIKTYEFSTKIRFKLNIKINNIDLMRIKYYFLVSIIAAFLCLLGYVSYKFIIIATSFLAYRIIIYLFIKNRNKFNFMNNLTKTLNRNF